MRSKFVFLSFVVWSLSLLATHAEVTVEEVKQAVLKELENRRETSADSPLFNPAMGLVLDATVGRTRADENNFKFRSAELNFQSTIDPFGKLYAIVNGTEDEIEVEEAALVTTRLPAHLTLRFGRYFANFGRLPKFHDHELPFVNRLASLDSFMDGETKADGVELTHVFYTPFFLQGTIGASNKIGAENERLDETGGDGDTEGRKWNAMTYNARLFTYIPIGDNHGLDIGLSEAYTPRQNFIGGIENASHNNKRFLSGADLTYRYEPVSGDSFRRVTWGSEFFHNNERRRQELAIDTDNDTVGDTDSFERRQARGAYSYIEAQLKKIFSFGGFYDYAQNLDDHKIITRSAGGFVNFLPSGFQKIRLQVSRVREDSPGAKTDHQFYVQWTGIIGRHAHTFKDR